MITPVNHLTVFLLVTLISFELPAKNTVNIEVTSKSCMLLKLGLYDPLVTDNITNAMPSITPLHMPNHYGVCIS